MGKGLKKFLGLAAAGCLAMCVMVLPVEAAWEKQDGVCYNDRGEVIEGAILKGIDVSAYQETIDWDAVSNTDVEFAFIRAGHGDEPLDRKFDYNMQNANRVGIPAGVYFYSMATSVNRSIKDAQFVIEHMQGYTVSYPVVVDMESSNQLSLSTAQRTDIAIAFCEEIRSAGYYPMIYCNEDWYSNYLDMDRLAGYDKWIARFSSVYNTNIKRDIWQATSSGTVNGISEPTDIDFAFVDYSQIVTPRSSSTPGYQPTEVFSGWVEMDGSWYYLNDDGEKCVGWINLGGVYYYLGSDGVMRTGWFHDGRNWYYCNGSGVMLTGWIKDGADWYYCNRNGAMQTGWLKDGSWYYLRSNGAMATGWLNEGVNWYYLNGTGSMAVGWIQDGATWYYCNGSGRMLTGWVQDGATWYFCNGSGAMQTGWLFDGAAWYYLSGSGAMAVGWVQVGDTWYYCNGSGRMLTGWIKDGGTWYYCNGSGAMITGWLWEGGSWYYLGANGAMATGWIQEGSIWHYLGANGAMATGWIQEGSIWYYLRANGSMAENTWIDSYFVNEKGAWVS